MEVEEFSRRRNLHRHLTEKSLRRALIYFIVLSEILGASLVFWLGYSLNSSLQTNADCRDAHRACEYHIEALGSLSYLTCIACDTCGLTCTFTCDAAACATNNQIHNCTSACNKKATYEEHTAFIETHDCAKMVNDKCTSDAADWVLFILTSICSVGGFFLLAAGVGGILFSHFHSTEQYYTDSFMCVPCTVVVE